MLTRLDALWCTLFNNSSDGVGSTRIGSKRRVHGERCEIDFQRMNLDSP